MGVPSLCHVHPHRVQISKQRIVVDDAIVIDWQLVELSAVLLVLGSEVD